MCDDSCRCLIVHQREWSLTDESTLARWSNWQFAVSTPSWSSGVSRHDNRPEKNDTAAEDVTRPLTYFRLNKQILTDRRHDFVALSLLSVPLTNTVSLLYCSYVNMNNVYVVSLNVLQSVLKSSIVYLLSNRLQPSPALLLWAHCSSCPCLAAHDNEVE